VIAARDAALSANGVGDGTIEDGGSNDATVVCVARGGKTSFAVTSIKVTAVIVFGGFSPYMFADPLTPATDIIGGSANNVTGTTIVALRQVLQFPGYDGALSSIFGYFVK
jgi:hypothetical protein